ncbi:hypothetical protein MYX65_01370 [Acidobacteria bacterium AH-259-L09]|nr:hypothetical protein [Acidobacteria bacterium AH-259-L09]
MPRRDYNRTVAPQLNIRTSDPPRIALVLAGLVFGTAVANAAERSVDRFGVFEAEFNASGRYDTTSAATVT